MGITFKWLNIHRPSLIFWFSLQWLITTNSDFQTSSKRYGNAGFSLPLIRAHNIVSLLSLDCMIITAGENSYKIITSLWRNPRGHLIQLLHFAEEIETHSSMG